MPEEESGFIFVDKRKTSADTEPEDEVTASEEPADPAVLDDDAEGSDAAQNGDGPSVYDLLQYMVQLLAAEAWHKMGLIANPTTGVATVDLAQARVAIDSVADIVGRLESAPESALEPAARRDLRNLLNDL